MTSGPRKKHPCPDCRMCQQCADSRCHVCRGEKLQGPEASFVHMSMAEQIRHFERLNRKADAPCPDQDGDSFAKPKNDV